MTHWVYLTIVITRIVILFFYRLNHIVYTLWFPKVIAGNAQMPLTNGNLLGLAGVHGSEYENVIGCANRTLARIAAWIYHLLSNTNRWHSLCEDNTNTSLHCNLRALAEYWCPDLIHSHGWWPGWNSGSKSSNCSCETFQDLIIILILKVTMELFYEVKKTNLWVGWQRLRYLISTICELTVSAFPCSSWHIIFC